MILHAPVPQSRCCTSGISCGSEQHRWTSRCRQETSRLPHCGPQPAALPHRPSPGRSGAADSQRQPGRAAVCSSVAQPRRFSSRSVPCHSSRRALMPAAAAAQAGSNGGSAAGGASGQDLLVVGPGVLGSYVGRLWLEAFPGSTVTGQTNTTSSHERWVRRGAGSSCKRRVQSCSCRQDALRVHRP